MQRSGYPSDYHRLRELQEREMSARAKDEVARQIHLELAEHHRRLSESEWQR